MSLLTGKLGRLGLLLIAFMVLNTIIVGALSLGGAAVDSTFGPTGDNILYAAIFLALTGKSVFSLVRRTRREADATAAALARRAPGAPDASEAAGLASFWRRLPLITLSIIGLTSITSILALDMFYPYPREVPLFSALYFSPALVLAGQLWRLLTVTLVHGSSIHLAFNMAALWWLGISEGGEARLGRWPFLFAYLASAAVASLTSLVFTHEPAVGASGAIMGLLGVLTVRTALDLNILRGAQGLIGHDGRVLELLRGSRHTLFRRLEILGLIAVATLLSGPLMGLAAGVVVDDSAHAGGLVAGLVIGAVFGWRHARNTDGRRFSLVFVGDELTGVSVIETDDDDEDPASGSPSA